MAASSDDSFAQALAALQGGQLHDAERHFKAVLRQQPDHVAALNILGVLLSRLERWGEAEAYIRSALKLNANSDATLYNYGVVLKALKRPNEALDYFTRALSINATDAEAWNNRGTVHNDLGRHDEAVADFDKAIAIQPAYADAYCNKGKSLSQLRRHDDSLLAYDKALALRPDMAEARLGKGNVFTVLGRYDEAIAAYDKALSLQPELAEAWLGKGNALHDLRRHDEAFAVYERALALKPDLAEAWLGRGNVFTALKRYDEALAAYDKALSLKPGLAEAWLGKGNALHDLRRQDEAFAVYEKALALKPDLAEAWLGRGNVFSALRRYDDALAAYDKATALKPDLTGLAGYRLHTKLHLADWSNFDVECARLISTVRQSKPGTEPFQFLAVPSSPKDQQHCARTWVALAPQQKPAWQGERYNHDKIRVAYVSADFREHPVSFLIAGLLDCHDKSRFSIQGISIGAGDDSELRRRIEASTDRFIDASAFPDTQVVDMIRSSEIDILVDLMGFTANARPQIFARRPAPVQVNYLGYLGTEGADYIDYIIADRMVIPEAQRNSYSEKVVYLPNSFQPTDRQRAISDKPFTRAGARLPDEGFVFCSFNASYKITPAVFDSWMRILRQVDGSVLWLVASGAIFERNLRSEAAARGINADRLIFAPRVPMPEHHARVRMADLFLDTLPYNAGATASDMLWAGLPVLTQTGDTFVGRMAASLLEAAHLPELITATPEAYEQAAVDFATNPEKLSAVKLKLAKNRLTTPLFDTKLYTRHIEAAYTTMHERQRAGLAPDHIVIPA